MTIKDEWENKIWGQTRCGLDTPKFSKHTLRLVPSTFCSFHYHLNRANQFKVLSGKVRIVEFYLDGLRSVDLTAGNVHETPSLVPHQFQVAEGGEMIEYYWPDRGGVIENSDIVRLTTGGDLGSELFDVRDDPCIFLKDGTRWECEGLFL